jgi:hypothetical protein
MNRIFKGLLALSLVVCVTRMAISAAQVCKRDDFFCYESGPSQNLTSIARMDATGIFQTYVTQQVTGTTVLTPFTGVALSSNSVITPTVTNLIIVSTGSNITMSGSGTVNVPVIATATATAGQWLILQSSAPLGQATVTISSGTSAGLHLGSATRVISQNTVLTLIFDGVYKVWKEVSFTGE